MRIDFFMFVLALLLILAMGLTLLFGEKTARHGYGLNTKTELNSCTVEFADYDCTARTKA